MTILTAFNRSKAKPGIYYLGRAKLEDGRHTITLSISGVRYAYTLTAPQADTMEFLCRRGLGRRALNYAKSRASEIVKT